MTTYTHMYIYTYTYTEESMSISANVYHRDEEGNMLEDSLEGYSKGKWMILAAVS